MLKSIHLRHEISEAQSLSIATRIYTTQRNAHGNMIVCRGEVARNSYSIIYTGTYDDCQMVKFGLVQP